MAGTEVGSLYYDLNIDDKSLRSQLDGADKSVKGFGDSISKHWQGATVASQKFAMGLGLLAAGAVAYGVSAVKAFKESQGVMAQTDAVIKSTGGSAGVTASQVDKLAKSLQYSSMYTDEQVASAENMLLTFTNIHSDVFPRTTQAVADMSQAMGTDMTQTAIMVGKALQDPVLGVTALQRVGVRLTESQKDLVKSLAETGHVAEAQAIILKELETEFGGSALAALRAAGPMAILKKIWEDTQETVGALVDKYLSPLIIKLVDLFDKAGGAEGIIEKLGQAFNRLKPHIPLIAGAIVGMLLPAMISLGISVATTFAYLAVLGAIGAGVVAVLKHFGVSLDDVKRFAEGVIEKIRGLNIGMQDFKDFGSQVVATATAIWDWFNKLPVGIQLLISPLAFVVANFKELVNVGKWLADLFMTWFWPSIKAVGAAIMENLWPALKQMYDAIVRLWNALNPGLMEVLKIIAIVIGAVLVVALWLLINVGNILVQALSIVISVLSNVINWISNLISWIGTAITMFFKLNADVSHVMTSFYTAIANGITNAIKWFNDLPRKITAAVGNLGGLLWDAGAKIMAGLINGIKNGWEEVKKFVSGIANWIKDHKGPLDYDSKLLVGAGKAIIGGLNDGLTQAFADTQSLVGGMGMNINAGIISPSVKGAGAGAGGPAGGVVNHGATNFYINTINDKSDAEYIFRRSDENTRLEGMGVSPV